MIFKEHTIKNVTFRNRVLRSSVGGRMCAYNGMVTDIWKNFELKFALGGVGGIISTTFGVNFDRQSPFEYPTISDDKYVEPLAKRIKQIRDAGCRYIVQIGDPGASTQLSLFSQEQDAVSSSWGFEPLYGYRNFRREMTCEQIRNSIDEFVAAAGRVKAAGADGIEITAEKGYLIHQFLNPGINRRKDEWGGSVGNRFRFLQEIVKGVRRTVGEDYLVGVRLAAADFNYLPVANFLFRFPWVFPPRDHFFGNDEDTTLEYATRLKALGIDFLHIVTGYGFPAPRGNPGKFPFEEVRLFVNATRHLSAKAAIRATLMNLLPAAIGRPLLNLDWKKHEGISEEYAVKFREKVGLPVIVNGGYQDRAGIERALGRGCDFVSMARALIATPDLINHYKAGEQKPEECCSFCNRCCGRTATSPLGCYEPKRFGGNRKKMIEQIMAYNTPDP